MQHREARPSRTPLVLLPGMLCDDRLFAVTADALREGREVRVLPLTGASVDAAVDAVLALPLPRFDLAGLSLGGIVAMHAAVRLAAQAPGRLGRLVLLSTNARAPRPDQHAGWDEMQRRALAGDLLGVAQDLVPSLLSPAAARDGALVRTTLEMARDTGVAAFLDQLDLQRSRTDLRDRLAEVRCPALVVCAQDDALCPPALHEEIAAALPDSRLVTVGDCGHLSPLERPEAVTGLLQEWLDAPSDALAGAGAAGEGQPR